MKLQLTPEQIRKKAKAIAANCVRSEGFTEAATNGIIAIIEEATGEIVQEFDEGKMTHGSLWRNRCDVCAVVVIDGESHSLLMVRHPNSGAHIFHHNDSRRGCAKFLELAGYRCVGFYDFGAGMREV